MDNSNKTMKRDIIEEYFKRASIMYLVTAILAVIIVLGGLIVYLVYIPQDISGPQQEKVKSLVQKQLEELEGLRENTEPLTEEQVQDQLEELEDLRQNTKPLTEEEVQKQLEELENLRNNQ